MKHSLRTLLIITLLLGLWELGSCNGRIFSFSMHHRFSEPIKQWSHSTGTLSPASVWPPKGSYEYYAELAHRDRVMRGRSLLDTNSLLAFSDGNLTFKISSLGFLYYTTVQLGTPGVKFLVALDTGSDLFWVPCDCSRCAPIEGTTYASNFDLSIYSPLASSTSKSVTCNNSLCTWTHSCPGAFSSCPYKVSYVSAETSTSGILIEDVLHLTGGDSHGDDVEAYVAFGCGQVQTGSFLDMAAPNGLLGLGMRNISVPSILSREGYMADSFSMCFGHDGIGRISLGDKGSTDQDETGFNLNPSNPNYNVTVTQIQIGSAVFDANITALFDSGTSFTYLTNPIYTRVSEHFHSQLQDKRRPPDPRIPFEYCYDMSSDENTNVIPSMSLTMKGGGRFTVHDPIIIISTKTELLCCLAIAKTADMNIIGQNFMTSHRIVFDRERLVLGWKKFNCYDMEEDLSSFPTKTHNKTSTPLAFATGISNRTIPHSDASSMCLYGHIRQFFCYGYLLILLLFSMLAILGPFIHRSLGTRLCRALLCHACDVFCGKHFQH